MYFDSVINYFNISAIYYWYFQYKRIKKKKIVKFFFHFRIYLIPSCSDNSDDNCYIYWIYIKNSINFLYIGKSKLNRMGRKMELRRSWGEVKVKSRQTEKKDKRISFYQLCSTFFHFFMHKYLLMFVYWSDSVTW